MPRTYCDGIVVVGVIGFSKASRERRRGPYRYGIVVSGMTVLSKVSVERLDGPCLDAVALRSRISRIFSVTGRRLFWGRAILVENK